ncbi:MAG: hypothetical protein F6K04_03275 [Leptolyngbya sp. SIO4C5]|uniref:hypothetical protein n=1 Tax=Sphaerothrix gracilis TaxID=3151835 RepID=UPI0013BF73CB|nr:hypothetical protein [Leptolyngbya sp. SIO4C5]
MRLHIDTRQWQSSNHLDFCRVTLPIRFKSAIAARWIKRSTRSPQIKATGALSRILRQ